MSVELNDFITTLQPHEQKRVLELFEELKRSHVREKSTTDFISFVKEMWPSFIEGWHHKKMAEAFERVASGETKRLMINMAPRHCLAVDTPIPTPNGWKTMATLRVGDRVFGPDGQSTKVIGKSQVYTGRKVYRAFTSDGAEVLCDDGHIWNVAVHRKRPSVFRNKSTADLVERQRTMREYRRPWLPDYSPVEYDPVDLPVPPYTLGVWLGDGHNSQAVVTMADEDQSCVRNRIRGENILTSDHKTPFTFGVLGIKAALRELGVLGNKHIPDMYLRASVNDRLSLLDGLMDTDGNVSAARQCFLATSSPVLRDQYRELLWSLGIRNGICVSRAVFNGRDYGETYRISFYAVGIGTLPRKRDRARGHIKPVRRYLDFEPAGKADVQCIEVDRDDGLFLAGRGFMVTHNTKSEFSSFLLPSWFLGRFPDKKIIQASHTAELSVNFGRKVRNLIASDDYRRIFPEVALSADSKAAGRWNTNKGGEYFAVGVGGALAGRGADIFIIDDPHNEQEATMGDGAVYDRAYDWYTSGPRQRLQPGGSIIIVATRWSQKDLCGQILQAAADREGDEWEVIEFPAILPSGRALWPEFWKLDELERIKAEIPTSKWLAQYQQTPTAEEGAIIKREWWQPWTGRSADGRLRPPECEAIIISWDTAFLKTNRSDYSACTTWGVFERQNSDETSTKALILLDAFKDRYEFPELKKVAFRHYQERKEQAGGRVMMVVEAKASGAPLIQEMRMIGIPVQEFTPSKGNDKIARANGVSDLFASGAVYAPQTSWADDVIEECAAFPNGDHDDYVDSTTQALLRFRQGHWVSLSSDYEPEKSNRVVRAEYY